ncbi:MAG: hypothetical protein QXT13_09595 [Pyrobaculum sp.]
MEDGRLYLVLVDTDDIEELCYAASKLIEAKTSTPQVLAFIDDGEIKVLKNESDLPDAEAALMLFTPFAPRHRKFRYIAVAYANTQKYTACAAASNEA